MPETSEPNYLQSDREVTNERGNHFGGEADLIIRHLPIAHVALQSASHLKPLKPFARTIANGLTCSL